MKIRAAVTHEKGAPFVIEEVELAPPQESMKFSSKSSPAASATRMKPCSSNLSPFRCPRCWAMRAAASWRPSARR